MIKQVGNLVPITFVGTWIFLFALATQSCSTASPTIVQGTPTYSNNHTVVITKYENLVDFGLIKHVLDDGTVCYTYTHAYGVSMQCFEHAT